MNPHHIPAQACPALVYCLLGAAACAQFEFEAEEIVFADGAEIEVPGYSVPSVFDWNNDGLFDLIVGEGSGDFTGKVRIYLNEGAADEPAFSGYFYAQSGGGGSDLEVEGDGCLGAFPRIVYWDGDDRKDLLIGLADGMIKVFLNIATDDDPIFDEGSFIQVGPPDGKIDLDIGYRATSSAVDWNNDGRKDLIVGCLNGTVSAFFNVGTDAEPDFLEEVYIESWGYPLAVISNRSSPDVADLDGDGAKDLLCGNGMGTIVFYSNIASDDAPAYGDFIFVKSAGVPIFLGDSARSRPFIYDWNGDDLADLLVGAADGRIHLFHGVQSVFADVTGDGIIDVMDLIAVLAAWGECPGVCPEDINGDGFVDIADLLLLLSHWS